MDDRVVGPQPGGEGLRLRRRLSLGVTAGLHRVVAVLTGVALAGHPRAGGIPAGAMVRCATEGWLWRSGRGRSRDDEARILAVSELARLHFLRLAVKRLGASR
jgi:hypothetical protein